MTGHRFVTLAAAVCILLASGTSKAQGTDLPIIPIAPRAGLPPHVLPLLEASYQTLLKEGQDLTSAVRTQRSQFDKVLEAPACPVPSGLNILKCHAIPLYQRALAGAQ